MHLLSTGTEVDIRLAIAWMSMGACVSGTVAVMAELLVIEAIRVGDVSTLVGVVLLDWRLYT